MLVRTWNLFHGNAVPRERRGHLERMVRLASEDAPDVLFLQEIPAWALPRLAGWSGMTAAATDVAARPPLGAWLGRWITLVDNARLRAGFAGQGNAILVAAGVTVLDRHVHVLNPWRLRRRLSRRFRLGLGARIRWASERRICQIVHARIGERTLLLANLHVSNHPDVRIRDAELERALELVGTTPEKVAVVGGDFNRSPAESAVLRAAIEEGGFSAGSATIDHLFVRGAAAGEALAWPEERRRIGGRLLSDHAPVEVRAELR